ncbi:MAG: ATP-grasp domain-containing protein, partial [Candidatus Micrarchaeota archaeon]
VANFPIHFEFIIDEERGLMPVEVNPMRFGGFGLADLTFHCFGINPYECYFLGKKPNWEEMLSSSDGDYHGFVLGRSEGLKLPNKEKFRKSFRKLDSFVEIKHRNSPVFCIAYAQSDDLNEIVKYVHFDFTEYETEPGATPSRTPSSVPRASCLKP